MKYSRQREAIKQYLSSRIDHPTADAIYMALREEQPNLSLGTVYRNLSLLSSMGEIRKIRCGDGADHFDADIRPHYHVICSRCGKVEDLPMEVLDSLNGLASSFYEGDIHGHSTLFYGTCRECMEKENFSKKQLTNETSNAILKQ